MEIMQKESDDHKPIPLSILLSIAAAVILMISVFSLVRGYADESMPGASSCDCSETVNLVCHTPLDSDDDNHSIRIAAATIELHLAHGDTLGACAGELEAEGVEQIERPCTCADGDTGYVAYSEDYGDDIYASLGPAKTN